MIMNMMMSRVIGMNTVLARLYRWLLVQRGLGNSAITVRIQNTILEIVPNVVNSEEIQQNEVSLCGKCDSEVT